MTEARSGLPPTIYYCRLFFFSLSPTPLFIVLLLLASVFREREEKAAGNFSEFLRLFVNASESASERTPTLTTGAQSWSFFSRSEPRRHAILDPIGRIFSNPRREKKFVFVRIPLSPAGNEKNVSKKHRDDSMPASTTILRDVTKKVARNISSGRRRPVQIEQMATISRFWK